MSAPLSHIVLLGRPNVGKSTLFNRLIRSNRAITHDRPGITRDRMEGIVRRPGLQPFVIVDTGGITLDAHASVIDGPEGIRGFEADILQQAESALDETCAVAFVVDGRAGLLPLDEHLANHIRRKNIPTICIVNKIDGQEQEDQLLAEFHQLGFEIVPVSAEHGYNIGNLCERLVELLPRHSKVALPAPPALRLAMLGRPNVGKSSLINAISGEKRMIVSDVAGTTRDSVDVRFAKNGHDYVFVDTAGVRRRTKITDSVEKFSVNAAIKSTTKADVTMLVLDAVESADVVSAQDKRLIDLLDSRKIPFMILINKTDLVSTAQLASVKRNIAENLSFCSHVPILAVSAHDGSGLKKILPLAMNIHEECALRVTTGQLNRAMEEVLNRHQPPIVKRSRAKFFYLTQAETMPPTFVFFVNDEDKVPDSYARYLEKSLRKLFGINHAPMRLHLRSSHKKKE